MVKRYLVFRISGLKNATNYEAFLSDNKSDLGFDNGYYYKNQFPPAIADTIFSASAGDIVGPYKDNGFYKISKIVDFQQLPDSVKSSHILIPYAGAVRSASIKTKEEAKKTADSIFALVKTDKTKYTEIADQINTDGTKDASFNLGTGFNDATAQVAIQSDGKIVIETTELKILNTFKNTSSKDIYNTYLESITKEYKSKESLQKQNWLPDLNLEYFQGRNSGISQSLYGFQVGLSVPILFNGNIAKSKVAKLEMQAWEQQKQNEETKIDGYIKQKQDELKIYQQAIDYYNQYGKKVSEEIIKVANSSYKHGEIDFFQYILSLENATTIQVDYLDAVIQFNKTQLDLNYINL